MIADVLARDVNRSPQKYKSDALLQEETFLANILLLVSVVERMICLEKNPVEKHQHLPISNTSG
jgi:hypothetical protein